VAFKAADLKACEEEVVCVVLKSVKIPVMLAGSFVSGEKTDFPSAENKGSERKSHQSVDRGTLTLNSTIEYYGHNYEYKQSNNHT
jgi:hypothetical protein